MTTKSKRVLGQGVAVMLTALAATAALVACGGGGGGDAAPATTQALTLSGTAAVGAPVAGRSVSVKCAAGTASVVTGGDGSYSVTIASGAWPCMAQVTASSGTVLNTVATASGTSAIANITPATQLVVAALVHADPSTYFLSFDGTRAADITGAGIAAAQAEMIAILSLAGVDFSAVGDLLASAFTTTYDAVLLALNAKLATSGTTLSALTTTLANASTPSLVSVPANLLLQPAAANCTALRSTTYRILTPTNGAALEAQSSLMTLDASALTVARAGGTTGTWVANGACRFTEQTGAYNADITVTQAGVLIARYTNDGVTYRDFLGFPEQAHPLSDLAGTWNVMGMTRVSPTTYVGAAGSLAYDANGAVTAVTNCQNNSTWAIDVCAPLSPALVAGIVPLIVDSSGGYDLRDTDTLAVTGRMFAFKAGSGDLMLATVDNEGELFVSAPVKSVALPAPGSSTASWNHDSLASFLSASPTYVTSNTVTGVDAVARSWSRNQSTNGSATSRPEVLFADSPRTGYVHRPSATVTDSSGAQVRVNEFTSQSMPGMGFTPLILLAGSKVFELSARQP